MTDASKATEITIDTSDMPVFGGLCCCNQVLWLDFPAFVGCGGQNECLCIKEEFCLRQGADPLPIVLGAAEGFICKLGLPCCSCALKQPEICLKAKAQCCCIVGNAALPPDEDTPLMLAVYGLSCFPVVGCCVPMKDVRAGAANGASAAPAANQS
eukprot:CAMPEP_0170401106 /NCGR_PEP_ID=MMETSP0117_2-20130122/24847_1 /TAXON_ID=400756 /ORGANISM="Durinskia baltica, Strain CSIRO CS-38" /LENGTH=154 /DNA_ID=CAMNT_0010657885 /DNA_START=47 /DNA_END=511 /DNA_ORIENTATION=+